MSIIGINKRLKQVEADHNMSGTRVVVIMPHQTDAEAFAKAYAQPDAEIHVLRVRFVPPLAA